MPKLAATGRNIVRKNAVVKQSELGDSDAHSLEAEQLFDNLNVDLLTIEETARTLNKEPQTIRNWIAKRQFPFVKVGNKHMVLQSSLGQWLKQKEFKPCA